MKTIETVYMSGLGAVGSSYAELFYKLNPENLKIIADSSRIKRYTEEGILVNGRQIPFHFVKPEETAPPADLIIIAVKQHQLKQAIGDIHNFVGEDTVILSFLNGIVSEEMIGSVYGMDKLLYSFVVGTDAVRVGTNINFSKVGTVVLGEKNNNTYSSKLRAVIELFDKAGIPYRIPENMIYELWWKFCMNVGVNQVSAILKAPYGVFQQYDEARELMRMACREVVQISEKADIGLTEESIERYFRIVDALSPEGKTSMLQDIEAGRKTEVEIFAGTVIELGRKHNIPTPINEMLYKMIYIIEQTQ